MAHRAQLTTVAAPSGAGKSYLRCARFLVDEFLPHEDGVSYSNFPVNIPEIVKHFEGKISREEIEERIQIIPDDVLLEWREGVSGPWDYFEHMDIKQAHIQIDEAHAYCHKKDLKQWGVWLGVLRHENATCELISQKPKKIPQDLRDEADSKIILIDSQSMRDPFLKIKLADWYEVRAMLTGKYTAYFVEQENKLYGETWKQEAWKWHARNPFYFKFYDSYNKVAGIGKQGEAQLQEYEKRTVPGLLFWFIRRNFFTLTLRGGLGVFALWSVVFGIPLMFAAINSNMSPSTPKQAIKKAHSKVIHSEYVPDVKDRLNMLQRENEELQAYNRQLLYDATVAESMYERLLDKVLEVQKSNDQIGMVFPDKAVTQGGRTVKAGDKLNTYEGEKEIKGINYDESKIEFTDGSDGWVTIGQRRVSAAYDTAVIQTDVKANERTGRRGSARAGAKTEVRTKPGDVQDNRPAASVSNISAGPGLQRNNRAGSGSRR